MMSGESAATLLSEKIAKWENNEEIAIFREYLRIPTVHPNIDYSKEKSFFFLEYNTNEIEWFKF